MQRKTPHHDTGIPDRLRTKTRTSAAPSGPPDRSPAQRSRQMASRRSDVKVCQRILGNVPPVVFTSAAVRRYGVMRSTQMFPARSSPSLEPFRATRHRSADGALRYRVGWVAGPRSCTRAAGRSVLGGPVHFRSLMSTLSVHFNLASLRVDRIHDPQPPLAPPRRHRAGRPGVPPARP